VFHCRYNLEWAADVGQPPINQADLDERVEAIAKLVHIYRYERAIYLAVTVVSTLALLASVGFTLYSGHLDFKAAIGVFAPTGGVSVAVGRSLKMWNDSIKQVFAG
jgi:hypothetical protein